MTSAERELLLDAFDANWVAPVGPQLDEFESAFAAFQGVDHAVAVSSGSAGLHLALLIAGVEAGDRVIVPTFTFAATANAVAYCGAVPIFVDSEPLTWNIDPALVETAIAEAHARGEHVAAVVTVDLYGQCADHDPIRATCDAHGIALIEDAAEAVGASWNGSGAGSFGDSAVFSFNGNKIMTTGGGGMLVSSDAAVVDRARHLSTQAREPVLHYEHTEIGFNYRMSNPLAAIGLAQVRRLPEMMARRAEIRAFYERELGEIDGVGFNPIDDRGQVNHWLTVLVVGDGCRAAAGDVIAALDAANAEARPAWKPMHLQPVFADAVCVGGSVATDAFRRGVCLPSGSSMSDADVTRVVDAVRSSLS